MSGATARIPCPGCLAPVASDAALCVACGLDLRTGHRLSAAIPASPAEPATSETSDSIRRRPPRTDVPRGSWVPGWVWGVLAGHVLMLGADVTVPRAWVVHATIVALSLTAAKVWFLFEVFPLDALRGLCCLFFTPYATYLLVTRPGNRGLKAFILATLAGGLLLGALIWITRALYAPAPTP